MLSTLAALLDARGRPGDATRAAAYKGEAETIARRVLSLYVEGKGYWRALYPNGSAVAVRHVIDFVCARARVRIDFPRFCSKFSRARTPACAYARARSARRLGVATRPSPQSTP